MGNTCYVVATVTIADWRMTVGFRALLMAVCRRPTPSRSLIPDTGSPISIHLSSLALSVSAVHCFHVASRDVPHLRRQIIYGTSVFRALISSTSTRDADRERDFISGAHREDRSRPHGSGNFAI